MFINKNNNKIKYRNDDECFVVCYYFLQKPKVFFDLEKALKEMKHGHILRGFPTENKAEKFIREYRSNWESGEIKVYCLVE